MLGLGLGLAAVSFTGVAAQEHPGSNAVAQAFNPVAAPESGPLQPVTIRVGPEAVGGGGQAYAVRSSVAGGALAVAFAADPPSFASANSRPSGAGAAVPTGSPVTGVITSRFGARIHPLTGARQQHRGVDLAASAGTPIVATASGLVSVSGWSGGYGLLVTIEHPDGWQTRYGHMSRVNVLPGQQVMQGDVIGFVGSTGNSTGPHVHYEVRRDGRAINPASN